MKIFRNLFIAGGLCACLLASCNSRSTTTLSYYETQCADAWDHGTDNTQHIANIQQYLSNNGVTANDIDLETDPDSAMVCLACQCLSGVKVTIEINESDTAAAHTLGFY